MNICVLSMSVKHVYFIQYPSFQRDDENFELFMTINFHYMCKISYGFYVLHYSLGFPIEMMLLIVTNDSREQHVLELISLLVFASLTFGHSWVFG